MDIIIIDTHVVKWIYHLLESIRSCLYKHLSAGGSGFFLVYEPTELSMHYVVLNANNAFCMHRCNKEMSIVTVHCHNIALM